MGLKHQIATIAAAGALLAAPASGSAAVLFENPYDTLGGNAFFTGAGNVGAENFALGSSALVERISFNAHHQVTPTEAAAPLSIDWSIRSDAGGSPGAVLAGALGAGYTTVGPVATNGDYELLDYVIDIPDILLGAGDYWVTFHVNNPAIADPHWTVAASGDGVSAESTDDGVTWTDTSTDYAFRIEGTVPAPATFGLLALGLALLGVGRRGLR